MTMATAKAPSLNIRVSEQTLADYDHIQNNNDFKTREATLDFLIAAYLELQELKEKLPDLTSEQVDLLNNAVEVSGMSVKELAKRGLIAECKKAVTLSAKQASLADVDSEDLREMTFKGVAATRIEKAITRIREYNDNQPDNQTRYCISESLVASVTGSNRNAIKDYFKAHKDEIVSHNGKYGLTNESNRKGKGINVKEVLGF